mmetsp:Transcript_10107/g.30241  ORF Transcript_10107/g.30241 Transcript_10107/m.30241 type:complete len:652 (+) Transcript_10107:260-2215(+)
MASFPCRRVLPTAALPDTPAPFRPVPPLATQSRLQAVPRVRNAQWRRAAPCCAGSSPTVRNSRASEDLHVGGGAEATSDNDSSSDEDIVDGKHEGPPITAATAAAQASTAHGLAVQAASAAQDIATGRLTVDGSSASSPARPRRDAFSIREPLSPSPSSSRDEDEAPQPAIHTASSGGGGGSRGIRERLRSPASQQRQQQRQEGGATPAHSGGGAGSGGAVASSAERLAELAEPSGYDSSGYSSNDEHHQDFQELLGAAEAGIGPRARSASDANVLRRKGHLKEQDAFISFLLRMHEMHSCLEVMQKMERWIAEHRREPRGSQLSRMVPELGSFFTPLKLVEAFQEYDEFFALSRRKYVPPNFAEMRHVLNIAQVHASAATLRLVTFDADGTLYADGAHMEQDNRMIGHIVDLMRANIHVAIVTAAGYPGEAARFEQRVEGLLDAFRDLKLPDSITDRFHIMGGECNYLLRVGSAPDRRLQFVEDADWKSPYMMSWRDEDITTVLDEASALMEATAAHLRLPVTVIRKERSVGVVPLVPTIYEVLEELAITVQAQLSDRLPLPFCAFNGGSDVFCDLGNKSLGLEALLNYLGVRPQHALHVGDRFTASGNDLATRDCCCILWVAGPGETNWFLEVMLADIFARTRDSLYVE